MKPGHPLLLAAVLALGAAAGARAQTPDPESDQAKQARLAWFREAKFGLFIHWGLYAIPAGEWKGKPIPGHRRVDHEPRQDPGEGVRAARRRSSTR